MTSSPSILWMRMSPWLVPVIRQLECDVIAQHLFSPAVSNLLRKPRRISNILISFRLTTKSFRSSEIYSNPTTFDTLSLNTQFFVGFSNGSYTCSNESLFEAVATKLL